MHAPVQTALAEFRDAYSVLLARAERLRDALEIAAGTGAAQLVIGVVCDAFGTTPQRLTGPMRTVADCDARWVAMWICYEDLGMTQEAIAEIFHRDHSAVGKALMQLHHRMETFVEVGRRANVARIQVRQKLSEERA